jgi:hypothetical protein
MRNALWLGKSLQVMAGVAERDGLRSTSTSTGRTAPASTAATNGGSASRDAKDGNAAHVMREPASEFLADLRAP